MDESQWLAEQFELNRGHLRGVAYRMMGSLSEADDAVQEAWLRLSRTYSKDGAQEIDNLGGWLTTVVGRVCLDMLRSRKSRREDSLDEPGAALSGQSPEASAAARRPSDPENEALLADSVGLALLVVLDKLTPAERLAFVLHDMFDLDFEEIGAIVGRSAVATRQLASRARRRVRGLEPPRNADPARTVNPARNFVPSRTADPARNAEIAAQRRVVDAFLTALRAADFQSLMAVLDPDLVVHADPGLIPAGLSSEVRGAEVWARQAITAAKGAKFARLALIDGTVGAVVAPRGRLFRVLQFTFADGRIAGIDVVADPDRLRALDLAVLDLP